MKKPDIKDEWIIEGTETEFDADFPTTCIDVHDHYRKIHVHGFDGNVYAQAISAVPEMIDALIEVYHLIQSLKHTSEWGVNVHPIDEENVKKALTKAGCQI